MELKDIRSQVDVILETDLFKSSNTYANLLRFLAEASIEGTPLKEVVIAKKIFGKKDYNPSDDTQVRVYIHRLRKKLDLFYEKEGRLCKNRLFIPKGSYTLELRNNNQVSIKKGKRPLHLTLASLVILGVVSAGLFLFFSLKNDSTDLRSVNGLSEFTESDLGVYVFLGDYFMYREEHPRYPSIRFVRNGEITNPKTFNHYVKLYGDPEAEYSLFNHPSVSFRSIEWTKTLMELFLKAGRNFEIKGCLEFDPLLANNHHVLILGQLNEIGTAVSYFKNYRYEFNGGPQLVFKDSLGHASEHYIPQWNTDQTIKDYCLVGKYPGNETGAATLVIGSLWEIGVSPVLEHFTSEHGYSDLMAAVQKQLGHIPEYYEILFEVRGIDNIPMETKVIQISGLNRQNAEWAYGQKTAID